MPTYRALATLSTADGRHIAPGEILDLDEAVAAVLLARGAVERQDSMAAAAAAIVEPAPVAAAADLNMTSPPARRRSAT